MLKIIKTLLVFLLLFVILLISILFSGIKVDSVSFSNLSVSQLYIKLDKKLILSINKLEYKKEKDAPADSIEDLNKNIELLPKVLNLFQEIEIKNLKIGENEFSIYLDNDDLYLDNKFINISSKIDISSKQVVLDLNSLYLKDYDVLFVGKLKLNYFDEELNYFGNVYFKDIVSQAHIDIKDKKAKFFLRSEYFKNIHFLKEYLDLPSIANEWMYDNVTGDFKLDWFYGEFDLEKNEIIEKSLQGAAHIKDAKVRFHEKVEAINTKKVEVNFKNGNLHFDLINPVFKNKKLDGSFVTIKNISDEFKGIVDVNIEAKTKLDTDVLEILKAYEIQLPILQKSGNTKAKLLLSFPYDEKKPFSTKGEFLVENSDISIDSFDFKTKGAKVILEDNMVYVKDASFLYENIIDASINISIDTNTLISKGNALIKDLLVIDSKNAVLLNIKDYKTSLDMNFNDNVSIFLNDLGTSVNINENIIININNLALIYPYSKLLQDYSIKDGNLSLNIIDKNNINFTAFISGLNLPLLKNKKTLNELDILGSLKNDDIKIFSKDNDIKIFISKKMSLYLKDFDIVIDSKNTPSIADEIDIDLENCSLKIDDEIYQLEKASALIKKDFISFEAIINDLDIPLFKDGKKVEYLEISGTQSGNNTKLKTKNGDLNFELINKNMNLYLNGYDISISTKDKDAISNFENIRVKALNSNIILNTAHKILAQEYELNLNKDEKFFYLKNKGSEISFKEYKDKSIDFFSINIDDIFINSLANKEIMNGGNIKFFGNGNLDNLNSTIIVKDSNISNLSILNNLLIFIQTSPALINPLLAIPSALSLTNLGYYKIEDSHISLNYNYSKKTIDINNLNTVGNGIDFEGKGIIDLDKMTIDSDLKVIFLKDYTGIVGLIPVLNYILLGDDNRVETKVNITGDLKNPNINTNIAMDSLNAPVNILKRILSFPLDLFNFGKNQIEKADIKSE